MICLLLQQENAIDFRAQIVEKLRPLGITIDQEKNNFRGELREMTGENSTARVFVIPTDEELMIALDTLRVIENS